MTGAALAILTGTVVGAGFMLWYGRRRFGDLRLLRRDNLRGWPELTPRLWRIGWPECTMLFLGYGIEVALVALVAQLGAVSMAANRLIENVTLISFIAAATEVALLAVVALVPLVVALNLGGVLRAAGDTRTVLVASLAGDAFLVPLAWLLALTLGLGLRGLMLAWLAYGLVFVAVSWWRYRTGSWRTSTV